EAKTGTVPAPGLVADVQRITEGNPFFVGEFVQMLQAEGALGSRDLPSARLKLPAELGATIRRRFASLTAEQRRLLEVAAVVGRDFDVVLLQAACGLPRDRVLGGLEPVLSARLIEEVSGALGSFRFAHALIREALYEDLTPTVRAQLHGRIGRALESVGEG